MAQNRTQAPLTATYNPAWAMSERLIFFDNQWEPIWDSATSTTPAYAHIATWVNTIIDRADGTRWIGRLYRCPEGIKRWSLDDLSAITVWPNPYLEEMHVEDAR